MHFNSRGNPENSKTNILYTSIYIHNRFNISSIRLNEDKEEEIMNKKIGIMIIVFAIILITLGVFFKIEQETGLMFGIDPEDVKLNEQGQPVLPFCDDKDECIKDLKSEG